MIQQLRLVSTPPTHAVEPPADALGRLFAHWLFMFGKSPRMCKLGPGRRRVLGAWLTVYDEGTLRLAVEGAAADAFIGERGDRFTSIEWILRDEAQIERYAEAGERLHLAMERERADEQQASAHADGAAAPPVSEQESQAARERLRVWAARRSGRAV